MERLAAFALLLVAVGAHVDVRHFYRGERSYTQAFRAAARAASGSVLLVPAGTYVTGGFSLSSNTQLHVASGATIVASDHAAEYFCLPSLTWDTNTVCDYALVNVWNATNVTISGPGTINGGANSPPGHLVKAYVPSTNFLVPKDIPLPYCTPFNCRIKLVVFLNSTGLAVVGGLHLANSPFWTLQFGLSSGIVVQVRCVAVCCAASRNGWVLLSPLLWQGVKITGDRCGGSSYRCFLMHTGPLFFFIVQYYNYIIIHFYVYIYISIHIYIYVYVYVNKDIYMYV
jgi:hypothetical protein